MNLVPILRFIFELSFSSVGKVSKVCSLPNVTWSQSTKAKFLQDLPTDGKDDRVLQCLQHFREMGLVMQRKVISIFSVFKQVLLFCLYYSVFVWNGVDHYSCSRVLL